MMEQRPGRSYVKDDEAFQMAKKLAERRRLIKAAAVKLALSNELGRDEPRRSVHENRRRIAAYFNADLRSQHRDRQDILGLAQRRGGRLTLFVDASTLTAIIGDEPERQALETALDADQDRLISGLAMWEAARAVSRGRAMESGLFEVERYCAMLRISVVPIGPREASAAVHAYARYGNGTGHPARLNMGDCFACACARTNNARLLYKGDDFIHTDLR